MTMVTINCVNNTIKHTVDLINNSGCGNTPRDRNIFNISYWFSKCTSNLSNLKSIISNITTHLGTDCKDAILESDKYAVRVNFDNDKDAGEKGITYIHESVLNFFSQLGNVSTKAINFIIHIEDSITPLNLNPNCDAQTTQTILFGNKTHMILKYSSDLGTISDCSSVHISENNQATYSSLVMDKEAGILNFWTIIGVGICAAIGAGAIYIYNKNNRPSNNTEDNLNMGTEMGNMTRKQ